MECQQLLGLSDQRTRITSVAVLDRTRARARRAAAVPASPQRGAPPAADPAVDDDATVGHALYLGTAGGVVIMFTVDAALDAAAADGCGQWASTASESHRRSLGTGRAVSVLHVTETAAHVTRLLCVSGGDLFAIKPDSLDVVDKFTAETRVLESGQVQAAAACHAHTPDQYGRFAVVAKKLLLVFTFTDKECRLWDGSPAAGAPPVGDRAAVAARATGGVQVGDVVALAWAANAIAVATRREYCIYDARMLLPVEQLTLPRLPPLAPHVALLPAVGGGPAAIALHTAPGVLALWPGDATSTNAAFDTVPHLPHGVGDDLHAVARAEHCLLACGGGGRVCVRTTGPDGDEGEVPLPGPPPPGMPPQRVAASKGPFVYVAKERDVFAFSVLPWSRAVKHFVGQGFFDRAVQHCSRHAPPSLSSAAFDAHMAAVQEDCAREACKRGQHHQALQLWRTAGSSASTILEHFPALARPTGPAGDMEWPENDGQSGAFYAELYGLLGERRALEAEDGGPIGGEALDHALLTLLARSDRYIPPALWGRQERMQRFGQLVMPTNKLRHDAALEAIRTAPADALDTARCHVLLRATHGEVDEALATCQAERYVAEAVLCLQQHASNERILAHLPWMMVLDEASAVEAVIPRAPARDNRRAPTTAPPEIVLTALAGCSDVALERYLGHVTRHTRCTDEPLHTQYALALVRMLSAVRGLHDMPHFTRLSVAPGDEAGVAGKLRGALCEFLSTSPHYEPDTVLAEITAKERHKPLFTSVTREAARDDDEGAEGDEEDPSEAPASPPEAGLAGFEARVLRFYEKYNPAKVADVPEVVARYADHQQELIDALCTKYGPEPRGRHEEPHAGDGGWLLHEQAVIHARRGDLSAALAVYVYRLHDVAAAEQFCFSRLVTEPVQRSTVARRPLSLALPHAVSGFDSGHTAPQGPNAEGLATQRTSACLTRLVRTLLLPQHGRAALFNEALRVLSEHSRYIDPTAALEAIPGGTPVRLLAPFLAQVCQLRAHSRTRAEITLECHRQRLEDHAAKLRAMKSRAVYIDQARPCAVCDKPLGGTVAAVFPNLKVTHYPCAKQHDVDPVRGLPFRPPLLPDTV